MLTCEWWLFDGRARCRSTLGAWLGRTNDRHVLVTACGQLSSNWLSFQIATPILVSTRRTLGAAHCWP